MNWRNLLIAAVLIGAVIASWLLLDRPQPPAQPRGPGTDTGYYLRDAVIEGTDTDGKRIYTLRADRIVQIPSDNSVSMEVVNLEFARAAEEPWRLTSDTGSIPASGERIELAGNVQIEEMLFIGPETTIVTTPELDVDLRTNLATTDSQVRIERGNYLITAVGLRADLKERKLTLQSEVHGRFLP